MMAQTSAPMMAATTNMGVRPPMQQMPSTGAVPGIPQQPMGMNTAMQTQMPGGVRPGFPTPQGGLYAPNTMAQRAAAPTVIYYCIAPASFAPCVCVCLALLFPRIAALQRRSYC